MLAWAGGVAVLLAWCVWSHEVNWRMALGLGLSLAAGMAAVAGWRRAPVGQLVWDGQCWRWESAGYRTGSAECALSVIADLQHTLILRLENPAHARLWLWAERRAFPERWMDLRRAVHSPGRYRQKPLAAEVQATAPAAAMAGWDLFDSADSADLPDFPDLPSAAP